MDIVLLGEGLAAKVVVYLDAADVLGTDPEATDADLLEQLIEAHFLRQGVNLLGGRGCDG